MQVVIKEWQTSGLSKKAFCHQRNISYHTFNYWCKRLISAPVTGFTELMVHDQERTGGYEIIFPSGARIVLQGEPSASWLREVVR